MPNTPATTRWSYDDEDENDEDFEIGEVTDRNATLCQWQRPDDQLATLGVSAAKRSGHVPFMPGPLELSETSTLYRNPLND